MFLLKLIPRNISFIGSAFTFHNVSIKTSFTAHSYKKQTQFTFHNVSIKTRDFGNLLGKLAHKFTFHNVSIKTCDKCIYIQRLCYLHSTMFLLKLWITIFQKAWKANLHSTMFLLKLILIEYIHLNGLNLHSTMFLLKQKWVTDELKRISHLHSTMFLLKHGWITENIVGLARFTFHNVSIKTGGCRCCY